MIRSLLPLALLTVSACSDSCANDVQDEVISPEGTHRAVLFKRHCDGADATTNVSVIEPRDRLEGEGNVLVAVANGEGDGEWGEAWVEPTWMSDDELLIRHDAGSRLTVANPKVSVVTVTFQGAGR